MLQHPHRFIVIGGAGKNELQALLPEVPLSSKSTLNAAPAAPILAEFVRCGVEVRFFPDCKKHEERLSAQVKEITVKPQICRSHSGRYWLEFSVE